MSTKPTINSIAGTMVAGPGLDGLRVMERGGRHGAFARSTPADTGAGKVGEPCPPGKKCGGNVYDADAVVRLRAVRAQAEATAGMYDGVFGTVWIGLPFYTLWWRRWKGDTADYPGCHCNYHVKLLTVWVTSLPARLWKWACLTGPRPRMRRPRRRIV